NDQAATLKDLAVALDKEALCFIDDFGERTTANLNHRLRRGLGADAGYLLIQVITVGVLGSNTFWMPVDKVLDLVILKSFFDKSGYDTEKSLAAVTCRGLPD